MCVCVCVCNFYRSVPSHPNKRVHSVRRITSKKHLLFFIRQTHLPDTTLFRQMCFVRRITRTVEKPYNDGACVFVFLKKKQRGVLYRESGVSREEYTIDTLGVYAWIKARFSTGLDILGGLVKSLKTIFRCLFLIGCSTTLLKSIGIIVYKKMSRIVSRTPVLVITDADDADLLTRNCNLVK